MRAAVATGSYAQMGWFGMETHQTDPWKLGYTAGWQYGSDMAVVDSASGMVDFFSGKVGLDDMWNGLCGFGDMLMNPGKYYDLAYLDYMRQLALPMNPYVPTAEDLNNLADESMYYWMRDTGVQMSNSSAWLRFAIMFFKGSKDGGLLTTAVLLVGSMLVGFGVTAVLKTITSVALMFEKVAQIVGTAANHVAKILLKPLKWAYKNAAIAVGKVWNALGGLGQLVGTVAGVVAETLDSFAIWVSVRLGTNGYLLAVVHWFVHRAGDFARFTGWALTKLDDLGSALAKEVGEWLWRQSRGSAKFFAPEGLPQESSLAARATKIHVRFEDLERIKAALPDEWPKLERLIDDASTDGQINGLNLLVRHSLKGHLDKPRSLASGRFELERLYHHHVNRGPGEIVEFDGQIGDTIIKGPSGAVLRVIEQKTVTSSTDPTHLLKKLDGQEGKARAKYPGAPYEVELSIEGFGGNVGARLAWVSDFSNSLARYPSLNAARVTLVFGERSWELSAFLRLGGGAT